MYMQCDGCVVLGGCVVLLELLHSNRRLQLLNSLPLANPSCTAYAGARSHWIYVNNYMQCVWCAMLVVTFVRLELPHSNQRLQLLNIKVAGLII